VASVANFRAARRMPPAERYPHGTRARYVAGCRCAPCTASNLRAYHDRQDRAKALAAEIVTGASPCPQLWTAPDGTRRLRVYARACPGAGGRPCPLRAHLRRDSKGGVCRACRERLVWNGLVLADRAKAHLVELSRAGVGYRSVGEAADVSKTVLALILSGKRQRIRASTERRILDVDAQARADHSTVPATRTWRRIRILLEEGFSKAEIARRLGYRRPALQLGRRRILAKNAARVERFFRLTMDVPA